MKKGLTKSFHIKNELGLHARAAALFVKVASGFRCDIRVRRGTEEVSGKSIMGILLLAAAHGSSIHVTARGQDSSKALEALGELIESRFGET